MKTLSDTEVQNLMGGLFPDSTIKLVSNNPELISVEVTEMFNGPSLGFRKLLEVSEAFGTMNIDTEQDIKRSGCETCDYGSEYGFTLYLKPE